jgi:hypothetical protein
MPRSLLLALILAAPVAAQDSPRSPFDSYVTSPEVIVDSKDGSLRLAHSVLMTDETGATDWLQTEALSDQVRAKKVFHLDSADVTSAELFIYGSPKNVSVNGETVSNERLPSTGWTRAKVPVRALKVGDNEIQLSGGGNLLVEPSKRPGRSGKSTDGGRTWTRHNLTSKGNVEGEYVIRLRLGRYAPRGWAISPVLDLGGDGIAAAGKVQALVPGKAVAQAEGTRVSVFARAGSTPTFDAKSWTEWRALDQPMTPADSTLRWAQLKFDLETQHPQRTPRIRAGDVPVRGGPRETAGGRVTLKSLTLAPPASPVPFVYEGTSPRLKFLREKYKLDDVIAPGKTELEQLMLLRTWVRNQWHTAWQSHPAWWMPPWDSLIILQCRDQPDCMTMCTHYGCVFTQCAQSLGWNARHCILDHHCVSEVYINQFDKWVMMDTGNSAQRADVGLHFEKNGVPLSARELHLAHRQSATGGITAHFTPAALAAKIGQLVRPAPKPPVGVRPDTIPLAQLKDYPVCQIENYRRYAFPARNNFLTSLYPGELYQGYSEYYYDGYYWVGDSPDNPTISPEYSLHADPNRAQEADWKLNWTRIYLSANAKPNELRVDLATHTPNLARFERKTAKGWEPTPASFVWTLQPGENTLIARSVNQWDKAGSEARAVVESR